MSKTNTSDKKETPEKKTNTRVQNNARKLMALGPAVAIGTIAINKGWSFWPTLFITTAITLLTLLYERYTSKKNRD